jgi:hypothetical protein
MAKMEVGSVAELAALAVELRRPTDGEMYNPAVVRG